jgi:hypothetical protein
MVMVLFTIEPFHHGALSINDQTVRVGTADETYLSFPAFPKSSIIIRVTSSAFDFPG